MKNNVKALGQYRLLLMTKVNIQETFPPTKMSKTGYNTGGKSFQVLVSMPEKLFHILCLVLNCFRRNDKSSPGYSIVAGRGGLSVVCHKLKMHLLKK